jgi:hypothetical protein
MLLFRIAFVHLSRSRHQYNLASRLQHCLHTPFHQPRPYPVCPPPLSRQLPPRPLALRLLPSGQHRHRPARRPRSSPSAPSASSLGPETVNHSRMPGHRLPPASCRESTRAVSGSGTQGVRRSQTDLALLRLPHQIMRYLNFDYQYY